MIREPGHSRRRILRTGAVDPERADDPVAATRHTLSDPAVVAALDGLRDVSGYFALGTGTLNDGWRPVRQLYDDTALLAETVDRVKARIGATEQRVAASTFFLGFAARLWSIGLGTVVGYRMLVDLAPERLLFREIDGQIALHLEHPVAAAAR